MDVELLKRIISDEESEIRQKFENENIVEREYQPEIERYLTRPNAIILSGVRRSGKSTSAVLITRGEKSARINFDHPSLAGMKSSDLIKLNEAISELKGNVKFVILDEVQNIEGWELFVSRLRETNIVIVTGSNSELMSEELASRLTGRYVSFTTFPFSFREYLKYLNFSPNVYEASDRARTRLHFDSYVRTGGFPEAISFGERFLAQIYSDILTKDIERRFGIRNRATFREFSRYILSNVSKEISFNKLKNVFDLKSVHTVSNYLSFLEKAFLVFVINKYSDKLKEQVRGRKKVYSIDTGMAIALGFRPTEDRGRLLENIVALQLIRRKHYFDTRLEIYYWKDYAGNEVDFVLKEGASITQLIQVSYNIDDTDTKKREVDSLLTCSDNLKCENLLVLTNDYEDTENFEGKSIRFIPIWKWSLGD